MKSIFEYNKIKYEIFISPETGFAITRPLNGSIDSSVYEIGHYAVKNWKYIPFLLNLPDFILTLFQLSSAGYSKSSSLVDFGCGKGYFLYFLKLLGYNKLLPVETSNPRADFAEKLLRFDVNREYYSNGRISGRKWNYITMLHVLEHIDDPFLFIDQLLSGAVEDDGLIYIEVPNFGSFSSSIAKTSWAHFTPHFHTNHFTLKSFKKYCSDRGINFKILGTFSFYNGTLGMASAVLTVFGYKGSIFEDLKSRKFLIVIGLISIFPFVFIMEFFSSVFFKRGSVIKVAIYK